MIKAGTSRARKIAVALAAAVVAAVGVYLWAGTGGRHANMLPVATPAPEAKTPEGASARSAARPSPLPSPQQAREPAPPTRPTPSVFDFATITPAAKTGQDREEERFRTNERFTQEDLQHPERYFQAAERVPELNRPEERRDTLAYFLAYREKLGRDLDTVGENRDERQKVLATIERYDDAIARLRKLIEETK